MEQTKIKVGILPNQFLKSGGTFDKDEAIKLSGKIAGVCYDKEGFAHLENEPEEKTMRRVDMTLNNGHHSVYDHILINFNLQNLPKILAMVLNNEHQYTTSEKSARYTPVVRQEGSIITENEERLYNKWIDIFKIKIKSQYGNIYNHEPLRNRKLLLHKKEILKLNNKVIKDGYTLIPTKIYLKKGRCKVEIALGKGKKLYDKRETIKKRDDERHIAKALKRDV